MTEPQQNLTVLSDPLSVQFEEVQLPPGFTIDQAYAFLVGADANTFGVPPITVAAGFDPNQLRDAQGQWIKTGHFPSGTKIYKNKYDAIEAKTPDAKWHFYDKNRKVWQPAVSSSDKDVESGSITEIHTVKHDNTQPMQEKFTPVAAQIKPTASDFKRLNHSSAMVMQNQMGSWSQAERRALVGYTSDDYIDVNTALRDDSQMTAWVKSQIKTLRSAMKPIPQNIVVYRSTGPVSLGISSKDDLPGLIGHEFVDRGFGSTTVNKFNKFPGTVKLEIELPKGVRGAYVANISDNSSEEEFIIDAATHYRVISAHVDEGGFWRVKLRAVIS